MTAQGFLAEALVYLVTAVVAVPIAQRLGLGSVLGYLLAGLAIGPFGLGFLAEGGESVMHFAEFGVVMMLFVIGLELEPARLWQLRRTIFGLGGLQVLATTLLLAAGARLLGLAWPAALAVGMALSLSSTAIVLQTLAEKGLLRTAGGSAAFAVLLFQDVAVIPMLALFPLLAPSGVLPAADAAHATTWTAGQPGWVQTVVVLSAVALVVAGGRWLVRPLFRVIARTRLRELFTAASLALVIGIALLMTRVGLSPALGTFLAGVVLATSEYRHELEGDIEPFKGLLLGLFFIAVGASVDVALLAAEPLAVLGLVLALMTLKLLVLYALGRLFGLGRDQGLLLAVALPQTGEFAFVLLAFAGTAGVLPTAVTAPLVLAVALSMALTPPLLLLHERVLQPRLGRCAPAEPRAPDVVEERSPVLVAGCGAFGSTVGRLLRASGVHPVVLDIDSDRVELLRALGLTVYYGDATRPELLRAAGAERAEILVIALDTPARTLGLVHTARRHFPHLRILARAFDWPDAHDLIAAGVEHVYRESVDTSLRLAGDALGLLGRRAHRTHRARQHFLRLDERALRDLTDARADGAAYLGAARRELENLERRLRADLQAGDGLDRDAGWDAESLREEARAAR